ncbi:hypothetical protein [Glutamicibacter sp.]|jgi:hypothetical protein|uniref:hypothetical protein n=1 Tax=Glutamicibacter sp. TaxID=1931995 RepID=UPI002B474646|nr:hypothetical protein [Glutamicibacter sp.]HJX79188.1 hypothetical protein [Glutamicibacter sp.]
MELEKLKLEFYEDKEKMTRDQLYDLINQLWTSEDKLYNLLDELRDQHDREIDKRNYRDDLD